MCGAWGREFLECHCAPPRACERRHLARKDRPAHPSDAQLERAADAVIAEDGSAVLDQCGHNHVNTAQTTRAKRTPSNVAFNDIATDRRYQMVICQMATV